MADISSPPRGVGLRSSADLLLVSAFSVLAAVTPFVPVVDHQAIRLVLTLPLVLFFPGYTLVSALFPPRTVARNDGDDHERGENADEPPDGLDGLERVAFSIVASVVAVAAIALALDGSGVGIRPVPVLFTTTGVTVAAAIIAAARRRTAGRAVARSSNRIPRFAWIRGSETRLDGGLNVALVVLILAAVGSIGVAFAGLGQTEPYTEFYLLTGDESETAPSAEYAVENSDGVVIGVENHEHRRVTYTVVVQRQRVAPDDPTAVRNRRTIATRRLSLDPGERRRIDYDVPRSVVGDNRRVAFLLYEGDAPSTPTIENADQETHLWTTGANATTRSEARRG